MKYSTETTIARPPAEVFDLLIDSAHYPDWMDGLLRMEVKSGKPGAVGTKTELVHAMGKREVAMEETIVEREAPHRLVVTYTSGSVWNEQDNSLSDDGQGGTRWLAKTEFRCRGVMWAMTKAMPGMFKKQTRKGMMDFKAFVEGR